MIQERYQKAFDALTFSPDFCERTEALLRQNPQDTEKGKPRWLGRPAIWATAITLLILSGCAAAAILLSPAKVAENLNAPILAQLFQSEDAILINESVETGDFIVTLVGMVETSQGIHIDRSYSKGGNKQTYLVVAVRRADGVPIKPSSFETGDFFSLTYFLTCLVSGYDLETQYMLSNGHHFEYVEDGVYYYLFLPGNLSQCADHTIYLAFYQFDSSTEERGSDTWLEELEENLYTLPEVFVMNEDGSYSFREDYTLPQAMFVLPLDPAKADPEAVQARIDEMTWEREHPTPSYHGSDD